MIKYDNNAVAVADAREAIIKLVETGRFRRLRALHRRRSDRRRQRLL